MFKNPDAYEIMWKIMVQPDRPQMTDHRKHSVIHLERTIIEFCIGKQIGVIVVIRLYETQKYNT